MSDLTRAEVERVAALARLGLDSATALVALSHDPKLDDPALQLALPQMVARLGQDRHAAFGLEHGG
jgi:xanthine/CO dehydrogenase XdhC/CoxF family maturation factor